MNGSRDRHELHGGGGSAEAQTQEQANAKNLASIQRSISQAAYATQQGEATLTQLQR
jgi:hypothetical protein